MSRVTTCKPGYYGAGSVEVAPSAAPNEGPVRRCTLSKDELVQRPFDGLDTVADILAYCSRTHGARPCLGWRDVLDVHEEEKKVPKSDGSGKMDTKKWKYFELSEYRYLSFVEVEEAVMHIAKALVELGVGKGEVFNVYAQTSPNWQLISHACAAISTPIATAYDTLGESGLTHSLNEPSCVGLFTNAELLPTLLRVLANTPSVKFVVFDGEPTQELIDNLHSVRESIQVFSMTQLQEKGKALPPLTPEVKEDRKPTGETLACIMYTSGSTGAPKGVCITHANLLASVAAVYVLLGHHLTYADSYLAYLPLAHVLEYIVEMIMMFVGMPIGYGRVKTLTDASVRNCKGDLTEFKPSIMVGVPAVWETIRKGILGKVNTSGRVKKAVFEGAMRLKKGKVPVLAGVADTLVLSGVRAATGGRLRIALSGGAAVSRETQEFLTEALVVVLQGYGMTESCGMCAILPPELMRYGTVGLPVPSTEVKLLDVPEAGYFANGKPGATDGEKKQQGEVCIKGPSVTSGYYKRPDLNSDPTIFAGDGWFRTGDVGQWNEDGTLSLIDRVKNLIKLQTGEYIALERLESIYKACNLVSNICVHASQNAKQPMAIIIPHEVHLRHALDKDKSTSSLGSNTSTSSAATAKPNGDASGSPSSSNGSTPTPGISPTTSLAELCQNPAVAALVLKECNALGKKNGFKAMELLEAVVLTPEEWTPESGLVTAAQKIQRSKIAKHFEPEIKSVYKY